MDLFNDELLNVLITDLRERSLAEFRHRNPSVEQLYRNHRDHSVEKERVLQELSAPQRQVLEEYIERIGILANGEMDYLYVRGIRDGLKLLKLLEAL